MAVGIAPRCSASGCGEGTQGAAPRCVVLLLHPKHQIPSLVLCLPCPIGVTGEIVMNCPASAGHPPLCPDLSTQLILCLYPQSSFQLLLSPHTLYGHLLLAPQSAVMQTDLGRKTTSNSQPPLRRFGSWLPWSPPAFCSPFSPSTCLSHQTPARSPTSLVPCSPCREPFGMCEQGELPPGYMKVLAGTLGGAGRAQESPR